MKMFYEVLLFVSYFLEGFSIDRTVMFVVSNCCQNCAENLLIYPSDAADLAAAKDSAAANHNPAASCTMYGSNAATCKQEYNLNYNVSTIVINIFFFFLFKCFYSFIIYTYTHNLQRRVRSYT